MSFRSTLPASAWGTIALLFTCAVFGANAQFTVQQVSINSGSQISHGGQFSMFGSAGQVVGGSSGGGPFGMQAGVSTASAPFQNPIIPAMVINRNAPPHEVTVSWIPIIPGYVLEFTDTLSAPQWFPWRTGTNTPTVIREEHQNLYFRLRNTVISQ
ncbi:MAG: hypothetical protein ACI9OD_002654 [Limisphaerales bacterium]